MNTEAFIDQVTEALLKAPKVTRPPPRSQESADVDYWFKRMRSAHEDTLLFCGQRYTAARRALAASMNLVRQESEAVHRGDIPVSSSPATEAASTARSLPPGDGPAAGAKAPAVVTPEHNFGGPHYD